MLLGVFYLIFCCLLVAFISFFIHGQEDQSAVSELTNRSEPSKLLGKFGAV
jgi:S-DNA-T family DNA segregation ATPase FtsK/SpoIIIE